MPERPGGKSWVPVIVAVVVLIWIGVTSTHAFGAFGSGGDSSTAAVSPATVPGAATITAQPLRRASGPPR